MTGRGVGLLAALITLSVSALSLGNPVYYYFAIALALAYVYALVSGLWALKSIKCEQSLTPAQVSRGDDAVLKLSMQHSSVLPIGKMSLTYYTSVMPAPEEIAMQTRPFVAWTREVKLNCRHVGQYEASMDQAIIVDLFGLFRFHTIPDVREAVLTVLPRPFEIDKPRFLSGDEGAAALSRTQEDYTSPADVRAYQTGDAMKRIHWKLSSRRRELIVRHFETPAPPDTLIILDTSLPLGASRGSEEEFSLRDALCETAVAIARLQTADGSPVRLPLYGEHANEYTSDTAGNLSLLQQMLARQTFDGREDFSQILRVELRRMRRTGATIIITTRLSAAIVDAVSSIRRMGPSARLYLVTYKPEAEEYMPFVSSLQHHLVEVCYVTPA